MLYETEASRRKCSSRHNNRLGLLYLQVMMKFLGADFSEILFHLLGM